MLKFETLLYDRNQDIRADGDPDLRLHRILAGAQKRLDAQVLLDSFEEQLDLRALPIQLGNQFGRHRKIVGQKRNAQAVLVADYHPTQRRHITLVRIEDGQYPDLVAEHIGALPIHRLRIATLEFGVAPCSISSNGAHTGMKMPCEAR